MRIIDKGIVFKGQEGTNRQSCAFPGICILPNGRWICTFRAAPQKKPTKGQHVLVTWSDDMGKSWTEPRSPFSPILSNEKFGLFRSAMPSLEIRKYLLYCVVIIQTGITLLMKRLRDCWILGFFFPYQMIMASIGQNRKR